MFLANVKRGSLQRQKLSFPDLSCQSLYYQTLFVNSSLRIIVMVKNFIYIQRRLAELLIFLAEKV